MSSQRLSASRAKPRGREATVAALVASARELYRSRTPAEVTMQEIADHAKVNRGLVHHYFGSKEDLFRAIFADATTSAADTIRAAPDLLSGLAGTRRRDGYAQMVGWALINGIDAADFVAHSPAIAELTRLAGELRELPASERPQAPPGPYDERLVVATAIALSMGWQIFEPFLIRAADLEDEPIDSLRETVGSLIDLLAVTSLVWRDDAVPLD